MATYEIVDKIENEKGLVFTFIEHRNWFEVLFAFLCAPFDGFVSDKTHKGFYPITEHGRHMTTEMCCIDGTRMDLDVSNQLRNLLKITEFKEIPAIKATADVES